MYYRIKLKKENKYSNCRNKPKFTKNGKVMTKQHLMLHMWALIKSERNFKTYDDCSLEEYEFVKVNDALFDDIKRQIGEKYVVDILKGIKT